MRLARIPLFFLVLALGSAHAASLPSVLRCGTAVLSHVFGKVRPKIVDASNFDTYAVSDASCADFQVFAAVEDEILEFSIQTVTPQGRRSDCLNAEEQVERIFAHFRGRFTAVDAHWFRSEPDGDALYYMWPTFSVNLHRFNREIAQGVTPETAALRTWTGRQMQKLGFPIPTILDLDGSDGAYHSVRVRFTPE